MIPDSFRPFRIRTALPVLLSALSLLFPTVANSRGGNAPANDDTFAQIAQAFSAGLKKEHVKKIVILDFVDVDGLLTPFGSWLADRLSAANGWAGVDVLDRKKLAAQLTGLNAADTNQLDPEKIRNLSLSQDSAVLIGSFAPAEGGIGVTLTSVAWRKAMLAPTVIRAKIELTSEMQAHLPGSLESLAPPDGVYTEAQGGVSPCDCDNQQFNIQRTHAGVEKGTASFSMVIQPDGKITDMSQCKSTGTLTNDLCRDLLNAPKTNSWSCKPAKNVDGRPVPARKYIRVSYTCGDNGGYNNGRDLCWVHTEKPM
jgi:hypothetical protein